MKKKLEDIESAIDEFVEKIESLERTLDYLESSFYPLLSSVREGVEKIEGSLSVKLFELEEIICELAQQEGDDDQG